MITSIRRKIFEKVIVHQLKENLHISKFQGGGQGGHSFVQNLLHINSHTSYFKADKKTPVMNLFDVRSFHDFWML